jgi:hypothetical protein
MEVTAAKLRRTRTRRRTNNRTNVRFDRGERTGAARLYNFHSMAKETP